MFAVIAFSNHNLTLFFDLPKKYAEHSSGGHLNSVVNFNVLPHMASFYGMIIAGLVLFVFSTLAFVFGFLKNKTPKLHISVKRKMFVLFASVTIILTLVSSFILIGVAEYQYSWFKSWVKSLHSKQNITEVVDSTSGITNKSYAIELLNNILVNNDSGGHFGWIPTFYVGTFTGLQIMFALIIPIRTRVKVYNIRYNEFNKLAAKAKKRNHVFNINYLRLWFSRFMEPNYKNISF